MKRKGEAIEKFPLWRACLLYVFGWIFKILGLAPFNIVILSDVKTGNGRISVHFVNSIVGIVYNLLLSFYFLLIICLYLPTMPNHIRADDPFIEISYEIGLPFCANGAALMIILIYCFRQKLVVIVFNQLFHLEDGCINKLYNLHQLDKLPSVMLRQLLIIIIHILINIVLVGSEFMVEKHPLIYLFGLVVPGFFIASFIIQYTLIVILLNRKFYCLNMLLSSIASSTNNYQSNSVFVMMTLSNNRRTIDDIVIVRKAQRVLHEILCNFTELYSLPILLAIVLASLQLIYHCYYFIEPFVLPMPSPVTILSSANAFIWILKDVFPIIAFTMSIAQTLTEMKKTSEIVHKIMAESTTQIGMQYELEQFSIELLHRNVSFMACGLFQIDGRLLKSIFSTMITYMVILLQVRREVITSSYNNRLNDQLHKSSESKWSLLLEDK